ncbi:hypothetical protein BDE02_12G039100 [Populus trichocarpa]|nr:hypothetical protein BDE02_12G039100 [Populus trichocarpa]
MSFGINIEHPIAMFILSVNGLAESLIKRLQLIARPLLMRTKLLVYAWGHLPNAFTNSKGVTKYHIPAINAPA